MIKTVVFSHRGWDNGGGTDSLSSFLSIKTPPANAPRKSGPKGSSSSQIIRSGASRPAMCRVREIHQTVGAARYPICSILAKEIEVTPQTILRDLNFRGDQRVLAERDYVAPGCRSNPAAASSRANQPPWSVRPFTEARLRQVQSQTDDRRANRVMNPMLHELRRGGVNLHPSTERSCGGCQPMSITRSVNATSPGSPRMLLKLPSHS